jgi:uncharacterized protein (DUF2336 family)
MSLLADVETLKTSPLPEIRESITDKITQYFNAGIFDGEELVVAHDIVRLLAKDIDARVRKKLAENLRTSIRLPHDVALALAHDVIEVATPILEFSTVLTDGDLLEVIRSAREVAKLIAISRRRNLQEVISSALVHTRNEQVVASLFNNKTAKVSDDSISLVIDDFRKNGAVIEMLISRGGLSHSIVNKLINSTSEKIRTRLANEYKLNATDINEAEKEARKEVKLSIIDGGVAKTKGKGLVYTDSNEQALAKRADELVKRLFKDKKLTEAIVLRALCEGNLRFFESSMAILAGVPLVNARKLVSAHNPMALEALCKKAKLPSSIFKAVQVIVEFAVSDAALEIKDTNVFKKRLAEYIMSKGYDKSVPLMSYILALIGSKIVVADVTLDTVG